MAKKQTLLLTTLLSLATPSCGSGDIHNHFYGSGNGNDIPIESGNCDAFHGRHIIDAGQCNLGTLEPVADDCSIRLTNLANPEKDAIGFIDGRTIHFDSAKGSGTVDLYRAGEFAASDLDVSSYVPEGRQHMANLFMCYFNTDPQLLGLSFNGKPIKASIENVWRITDTPFPSYRACKEVDSFNSAWYKTCRGR